MTLGFEAVLEHLVPSADPTAVPLFEQAVADLGSHLGYAAQRPERDHGVGPDDLWHLGGRKYLVIECKSNATTDEISKHDAA